MKKLFQLIMILSAMLDPALAQSLMVFDLMETPSGVISIDEDLAAAMAHFERCERPYLPVYAENGGFSGFIFKDTCLAKYRALIREIDR